MDLTSIYNGLSFAAAAYATSMISSDPRLIGIGAALGPALVTIVQEQTFNVDSVVFTTAWVGGAATWAGLQAGLSLPVALAAAGGLDYMLKTSTASVVSIIYGNILAALG